MNSIKGKVLIAAVCIALASSSVASAAERQSTGYGLGQAMIALFGRIFGPGPAPIRPF